MHDLAGHEGPVTSAALLADGQRALSWAGEWSKDGILKLWDLEQGTLLYDLTGHEGPVTGAALLASGRRALSWSRDHTLKLWDLEQGTLLHDLAGHERPVIGAALLANGQQALSWSEDRTLKLWDVHMGKELGFYLIDAVLSPPVIGFNESRIFMGDAFGRLHCLCLKQ